MKMKSEVETLFMQEKPPRMMLVLRGTEGPVYAAIISKETDSTYAHTLRVLVKLECLGMVKFEESGRVKLVRLTDLGRASADVISGLLDLLKLSEVYGAVEALYDKEVKGHLREDIDKESVLNRLEQHIKKLDQISQKPEAVDKLVKKQLKRIDEISQEVKGTIVG